METAKFFNAQPKENLRRHPRPWLDIIDIFLTIQGEGPFTGHPAIFIRTAGCNLDCPGCDTNYTNGRRLVTIESLVAQAKELRQDCLVVITGGEPLRQSTIGHVCSALLRANYKVQIETNGTFWWEDIQEKVDIVCSPKTEKLHPDLRVDAYKYVLTAGQVDEEDGLPLSVLGNGIRPARPPSSLIPVYVAPADNKNEKENEENLRVAVQSVLKHGYVLSIQTQKIAGLS